MSNASNETLRLVVLARDQSDRVQDAWRDLKMFLDEQSGTQIVAAAVTEELPQGEVDADLAVVLGGDGAILRACGHFGEHQLPILGINLGRLGFLADLTPAEFRSHFPGIRKRDYRVVEHLMYHCTLRRGDGSSESWCGLNEVAVSAGASLQMIGVRLDIDGEHVATYSCDGLIISTPVGSTAHSLSAGGPILRQQLRAFVITPVCPHTLTNRPLVDSADCTYALRVPAAPEGTTLVIDGQTRRPVGSDDTIEVRAAPMSFKLVKVTGSSYYKTLHRKLGWAGQPRYQRK